MDGFDSTDVPPPFSSFAAPPTVVAEQMEADGLSLPSIATRLRRWAIGRGDVLRLVLGNTGKRYTVAVLVDDLTTEKLREVYGDLRFVAGLLPGVLSESYVLGPAHADAELFRGFGSYAVYTARAIEKAA